MFSVGLVEEFFSELLFVVVDEGGGEGLVLLVVSDSDSAEGDVSAEACFVLPPVEVLLQCLNVHLNEFGQLVGNQPAVVVHWGLTQHLHEGVGLLVVLVLHHDVEGCVSLLVKEEGNDELALLG